MKAVLEWTQDAIAGLVLAAFFCVAMVLVIAVSPDQSIYISQ